LPRRSSGSASELDRALYIFFRTVGHTPRLERAIRGFSRVGEHGLLWQAIALTGAALDQDRRPRWIRAWAAIAGSFAVNQLVKLLFRRPRPDLPELPRLMGTMSNRSYPSAHATTSAAASRVLPPLLAPALGSAAAPAVTSIAAAMSLSRLYLGVHWPSDVAAGYALGAAVAELAS
jgi:membrane-associated phospholipid phosphatase